MSLTTMYIKLKSEYEKLEEENKKLKNESVINMIKVHFGIRENDINSLFFYDRRVKAFILLYYGKKLEISENFVKQCLAEDNVDKLYDFIYKLL